MRNVNDVILAFALVLALASTTTAQDTNDGRKVREEQAYTLGTAAYTWGFTMTELYRVRDMTLEMQDALNRFAHARELSDPETSRAGGVVSANNATLYSVAWLDLLREPVVLDIPPIPDRYYTMNYIDFYQKVDNISNLTDGRSGGSYAFTGPGWEGILPDGVKRISSATNHVWILGRTEVKGPDDLPAANAVQDHYTLTVLSEWREGKRNTLGNNEYDEWPRYNVSDPLSWYAMLNETLRRNPPYGPDASVVGMFESIGIGPDKEFDPAKIDAATASGLRRAVESGHKIIAEDSRTRLGQEINHWSLIANSVDYSTSRGAFDYLFRSSVALRAQPGQDSKENFFNFAYEDDQAEALNGSHRYTITFQAGDEPPVAAFWSITMYDHPDGFMVDNPINRYSIGTYDEMKRNANGDLTIHIQHETPGAELEGNWLPAPDGPFYICLRLYNAEPEALNFDWVPPAVKRAQ
ncbi:MAG: DUF1254 domain-containing protein [Desulfosarcina sp.]|nr:DUF1254 domain-containing protein [Desulfosarcina sp.]MBC2767412.1 DUF1254 domain-containing protein [Desulfosarcina sp.]